MTLALPWHSNPAWRPTEVTQCGAGTLIVGTDGEEGSVWGNDKRLLEKIDNPDAISGLVVVDTWLRNTDRHYLPKGRINWDNVFFS